MPDRPDASSGRVVAVVLGAGQGARMGADRNKVFLPLGGRPILSRALEIFERAGDVDEIVLVAHPLEVAACEAEIVGRYALGKVRAVIPGGDTRHHSEERALAHLRARIEAGEVAIVLLHDGARPFVAADEVARVIAAARATGGALLVSSVADDEVLLAIGEDGTAREVYPSAGLARAQTPQAFAARPLLAAYDAARATGFEGTDTAASFARMGYACVAVPGSSRNIKITTPDDLLRAEALLSE